MGAWGCHNCRLRHGHRYSIAVCRMDHKLMAASVQLVADLANVVRNMKMREVSTRQMMARLRTSLGSPREDPLAFESMTPPQSDHGTRRRVCSISSGYTRQDGSLSKLRGQQRSSYP